MSVTIFYRGQLDAGKTVDELVDYIEDFADKKNLKSRRPHEFYGNRPFTFKIPEHVIWGPTQGEWMSNEERIRKYASEAGLDADIPYRELCGELNSLELEQVGIYVWLHEKAEPLRFVFVEGDSQLTELKADSIDIDRREEPLHYVTFYRDSLATKTAYGHDPQAHQDALDLLKEVNHRYFGGTIEVKDFDGPWFTP